MNLRNVAVAIATLTLLSSCSGSDDSDTDSQDSIEIEVTEENLGEPAPVPDVVGLYGDSIANLENQVLEAYKESQPDTVISSSEPVSTVAGIFEVTWDLTGFEDDSVDGTRIVAQIRENSPTDGQFQIGNAIQQPLCLDESTNCE